MPYRWKNPPDQFEVAECPKWLLAKIPQRKDKPRDKSDTGGMFFDTGNVFYKDVTDYHRLWGNASVDGKKHEATRDGQAIPLQAREFSLLEYLMRNRDRVVSKTSILENVYDYSFDPQTNVVDVLVCRLRNKIDKEFDKKMLHTVRGMGYVLKSE